MGHIDYKKTTRGGVTPPEWLTTGAQIGILTNGWSSRSDIVAYVGDKAGAGAPACFTPVTAEVEVDLAQAFGPEVKPEQIGDLQLRTTQFAWPRATGLIFHEAMHARFSTWDIQRAATELTPAEFKALILLEESRIEAQGVRIFPDNACFLRACVLDLVMKDITTDGLPTTSTRACAHILALTSARVTAGSVMQDDIIALEELIIEKIGLPLFMQLSALWAKVQTIESADTAALYAVAREWAKLVEDAAEEAGEGADSGDGQPGEGVGAAGEFVKELVKELAEAAEAAAIEAQDELNDQQTTEEWRDEAKQRGKSAAEQREHEKIADDVFAKSTGPLECKATSSRLVTSRPPTAEERRAAVRLALALEKAKYRERDAVDIASIVPPGRLRTRAIVQGAALKAKGVMTSAEPWRRTVRKHTDDPTLSIGVMVDISGSMSFAMEPMAVTAWVLSEATRRVQGRSAMVYYGSGVFSTLKPGQHLKEVNVYSASDGTERFNIGFKALNGALSLTHGAGARMLVVVSDGCYTPEETSAAARWVRACDAAGVAVTWVDFGTPHESKKIIEGTGAQLVQGASTTYETAEAIGRAAVKALAGVASRV